MKGRRTTTATSPLARALDAFEAGDEELSLEALLEVWRAVRAREIAELIDLQSARLAPHLPVFDERSSAAFHPTWVALAGERRAVHFPLLIDSVLLGNKRFGTAVVNALVERGELLATWPADPRTAPRVVALLAQGGYEATSRSTYPFWTSLLSMVRAHDDPRSAELLRPLQFSRIFRTFSDGKRRIEWFQGAVDGLVAELEKRHAAGTPPLPRELETPTRRLRDALSSQRPVNEAVREQTGRLPILSAPPPKPPRRAPSRERGSASDLLTAAVRATDDRERLTALLDAWRIKPATEITDLVEKVSRQIEARLAPIRGTNRAAAQAEWLATAKKLDPADLPRLLDSITDTRGRSTDALVRVEALADWPRDPRTLARVAAQLEAPPFHSSSASPFWTALIRLAQDHGDPRGGTVFEALANRFDRILAGRWYDRRQLASWFRRQVMSAANALGTLPVPALEPDEVRLCAELALRLGDSHEVFLRRIAEHPQDDEARVVYADWLQERNDPRGEFIALQIGKRGGKRVDELQRDHAHAWVGPLAPLIDLPRSRFERGFLAHVELRHVSPERLAAIIDDPIWATVRTLHLGYIESDKTFPVGANMRSLERVTVWTGSGQRSLRLLR